MKDFVISCQAIQVSDLQKLFERDQYQRDSKAARRNEAIQELVDLREREKHAKEECTALRAGWLPSLSFNFGLLGNTKKYKRPS
jgi:hypothetical protein